MLYFVKLLCHLRRRARNHHKLSSSRGFARYFELDLEKEKSILNDYYVGLHVNKTLRVGLWGGFGLGEMGNRIVRNRTANEHD